MIRVQGTIRPLALQDKTRNPEIDRLVEAWSDHCADDLFDFENGPLNDVVDDLVVVELTDDGHFLYIHYGLNVQAAGGLLMLGKRTDEFETGVGAFFARSYHEALALQEPVVAVNKAKMTHVTHSWLRLLLPVPSVDGEPDRVLAMVRPLSNVSDVLADFTRDIGFWGGTLEPVIEDDMVADFVLLSVSLVSDLFGDGRFETLSDLLGRSLTFDEIDKISTASDGVTVINRELPHSQKRFGCSYVLKVSGGDGQPVFSLIDSTELLDARNKAEERKNAMESFADIASDWLWETDVDHNFTMMSPAIQQVTGIPHTRYIGTSRLELINAPANAEVLAAHMTILEAQKSFRGFTYKVVLADGRTVWARANGDPRFAKDGSFLGYRGTGSNITDEVEARDQAARRTAELGEAHRIGRLGSWRFDRATNTAVFSPEFYELIGLPRGTIGLPREDLRAMYTVESRALIDQSHARVIETGKRDQVDLQLTNADGELMDLSMITRFEKDGSDGDGALFGTVQDITERKKAERELQTLAFFDPLTGLGNRSYFGRELKEVFTRVMTTGGLAGLLLLDLDHFKEVNDTLGHAAGDELLRRVAEKLVNAAGFGAMVCRLGGDEFAIIAPQITSAAELGYLASSINAMFASPIKVGDGTVHATTSAGMVIIPSQTVDVDEAMRFADLALYEAKSNGRNQALLFHSGLDESVRERVSLARDLRNAIKQNELETHFQLQIDVAGKQVAGFEALMRWKHPRRGYVPPDQFVPVAESSRLISDLGVWIVNDVCRQGKEWLDAGGAPLPLSVNVSVAQLWHTDVASEIRSALDRTGFPAELLWVELTESVFNDDTMPRIQRLFNELRHAGVRIALDDFGTGFSNLNYLNTLNFDKLKIDRSFISGCESNPEKRRLLQGIVGLAKGLDMGLIVEGVETEKELETVRDLGCDVVQGFFFAKPKPFHEACLDAVQIEAEHGLRPVLWKADEQKNSVVNWAKKWAGDQSA